MKIEIDIPKLIRRVLILLAVSAVCVLILVCLFTNIGSHTLFRIGVWLNTEDVDVNDTAHLEYFDVKAEINDSDSYRIFMDEAIDGSYEAALDFLKFIKQNTDVNIICMDISELDAVNAYLSSGDSGMLPISISENCAAFLQKLYIYNQMLPPQKRVSIANEMADDRCFIIESQRYDRTLTEKGILDVGVIYPDREDCDPLFDVDSLSVDHCRIRFGTQERLKRYISVLEALSGNFGMPEFEGVNQAAYYFMIENSDADEGGVEG